MLNKIYEYKIISIIFIVLLTSIAHGLNVWQYTIYNFDPLFLKENSQNYILDPIIMMNNKGAYVLNIFNDLFKPLLQIPILYFISSIAIKSTIVYLIYRITDKIINDKKLSFVIALFFIVSFAYTTHGIVLNGFWGGPIFFRASASGLMTLIGLYLVLTRRYYLAIIPFMLSINLHILYGVTSFSFIFSSVIFYLIVYLKKDIKEFLLMSVIVGLNTLPILLSIDNSAFSTINSNIEDWYYYVFATDPDDMSMLYYLGTEGYFAAPFIFLTVYFYISNKNKQMVDYLFMGSLILLAIIIVIELLHYNSIFFGGLSEKFIGVQFRRGIWILLLFSAIINFINFQKFIDNGNNQLVYLLIGCGFIYLLPNVLALYIVLLISLIYFKQMKIIYLILLSIVCLYLGLMLGFYHPIKLYESFAFILVATSIISGLFYYKLITKNNILLSIIIFFVLSMSLIGFTKGRFQDDLNIIATNGLFASPNLLKLEKNIYKKQGKVINNQIIEYIRNNNPKKEFVLESMDNLFYGDAVIYESPIFLSRGMIAMPMFSRLYYEYLLFKLNIFGVSEQMLHESKEKTLSSIKDKINSLSKIELKKLKNEFKIRFLISKKKFLFLEPTIEENQYYLYDLDYLK
jgi:hypothetical protein